MISTKNFMTVFLVNSQSVVFTLCELTRERKILKIVYFLLKLRQKGMTFGSFLVKSQKFLHFVIWRKKVLFCWNYNWLIFTGMRKKNVKRNCVDFAKTNNAWLWPNAAVGVWCNGVAQWPVGVWFEAVAGLCSVGVALNDLFRVIRVPGLHFNTAMAPLFATFAKRASVMAMTW